MWHVALHVKSIEQQNNPGAQDPKNRVRRSGHYQARNFMVFSDLYPDDVHGMEFELTESNHYKDLNWPLTISACYKEQSNNERSLEARSWMNGGIKILRCQALPTHCQKKN